MKRRLKLKGILNIYLRWPLFLSILFLVADIHLFFISFRAGMIGVIYLGLYLLAVLLIYLTGRRRIRRDLIQFAANYGQMQKNMLKELDVPYAVLSEEGQLLWGNDKFLQVIVNKKAARKSITNIFPEITYGKLPKIPEDKEVHVQAQDRYYRCRLSLDR